MGLPLLQPAIASTPSTDGDEGDEEYRTDDNENDHKRAHMTSIVVLCSGWSRLSEAWIEA